MCYLGRSNHCDYHGGLSTQFGLLYSRIAFKLQPEPLCGHLMTACAIVEMSYLYINFHAKQILYKRSRVYVLKGLEPSTKAGSLSNP